MVKTARPGRGRRIASVTGGGILTLGALGLITVGGYALSQAGGYVSLGNANYHTDGSAVVSDSYDWAHGTYLLGGLDKVRIKVIPSGPGFVGLATPKRLDRYLTGVAYTTGHQSTGHVTFIQHPGGRLSTAPTSTGDLWTAQRSGSGPLTLTFTAGNQRGDRVLAALNSDGSPSVTGRVETAATVPSLPWIGTGMLAGGVVLLAPAAALVILPFRRRANPRAT